MFSFALAGLLGFFAGKMLAGTIIAVLTGLYILSFMAATADYAFEGTPETKTLGSSLVFSWGPAFVITAWITKGIFTGTIMSFVLWILN